ncbi:ABC transporter permease subunit [Halococcus agarilyticus]|uniref:ABC transporter permease subunit n=1 Tax=Halococcus agarilyticus TaxID=1232219 RepID=UPI00067819E3|nr:ABC transporter permease subunit [Halococcus agarilyticus]
MKTNAGTIATKEIADATRSRLVWFLVVAFVVVTIPQLLSFRALNPTTAQASRSIAIFLKPFIPLVGLLVGYKAIVGERDSGSLRILLGLPGTRRDIVLGKILGRSAVFLIAALSGFIAMAVVIRVVYGGIDVAVFVGTVAFMLLYGLSWVGIAVGLSAAVATRFRAMAGAVGLYSLCNMFWNSLVLPITTFLFTGSASTDHLKPVKIAAGPEWYIYFQRLNPTKAFEGSSFAVSQLVRSSTSLTGVDLFGVGVLAAWFVLPVLIGYWRFNRVDLG